MVYCERLISYMIVCGTIPFTKTTQYDINKKLLIYTRFILVVTFVPLLLSNYSLYNLSVSSPFTHAALTGTYFGYGVSCFVCTLLLHFRFKEISSVLTTIDHYCCSKYIKESHQSNRSPWLCRLLTWNFAFGEFFVILFFIVCVCSSEGYGFSEAVRASIVNHYNLSCDYLFIILSLNGYIVFSGLKTSFQEETEGVRRKYTKREGSILNARDEEIRSKEYRGILFNYYREYSNILGVFEDINECFGAINLVSVTHDLFVTVCVCVIYFVRLGKEDLVVDLDIYYSVFFCQNKVIYRLLIAKLIKEEVVYRYCLSLN